ncbi:MAG: hypothetical protein KME19_04130 [Microcoleus vaginatus WJT46-NPBG5]|nr:hypothetical protein [Microcoleus vaginatus WJT46-NPBG5]
MNLQKLTGSHKCGFRDTVARKPRSLNFLSPAHLQQTDHCNYISIYEPTETGQFDD